MGQEPTRTTQAVVRFTTAARKLAVAVRRWASDVLDAAERALARPFVRRAARRGTVAFRTPPTKRRLLALRLQGLVPAMAGAAPDEGGEGGGSAGTGGAETGAGGETGSAGEGGGAEAAAGEEGSGKEPKTFTEDYVHGLREEAAGWRTKFQALDAEKREREDAGKTELQRAVDRGDTAEGERDEARTELWRYKAASKHGIPDDLVDLITGSDERAMDEKAEKLAKRLGDGGGGERRRTRVPRGPQGDGGGSSMNDRIRRQLKG